MAMCAKKNALWGKFLQASGSKLSDALPSPDFAVASGGYGYETAMGRASWPSRDPIEERGGINLYGMVGNNPVVLFDRYGLEPQVDPKLPKQPSGPPVGPRHDPGGGEPEFNPDKNQSQNCYTYACQDYRKLWATREPNNTYECGSLSAGFLSMSDGKAREIKCPDKAGPCVCNKDEYLVMLYNGIINGRKDFHFYRQDSNGYFSYQIGGSRATYLDFDGKPINDPESANRTHPDGPKTGSYNKRCGCFCVKKGGFVIPLY